MLRGDLPLAIHWVFLTRRKRDKEITDAQDTRHFKSFCGGFADPPDFGNLFDKPHHALMGLGAGQHSWRELAFTRDAYRHRT